MKPSQLVAALECSIQEKLPFFIWGAAGIGKSDLIKLVAEKRDLSLCDLRVALFDPVDLRGLPRVEEDKTVWQPPAVLPRDGKGILFLDELTTAPQMIQAACYQLVLDRKLGEYTLPDGWVVVAAGNPASERGVHFSMPRPLRNRFVHLTLEPDFEEFCEWSLRSGRIRHEIIAFLRFRQGLFFSPGAAEDNAWPTPRSWEMASRAYAGLQSRSADTELIHLVLKGAVGDGAAIEFTNFLNMLHSLPPVEEILLNPTTAPIPQEPSGRIAVATALGRAMTAHSIANGCTYLERLDAAEFVVLAMRDASLRDRTITHTQTFVNFGTKYRGLIV